MIPGRRYRNEGGNLASTLLLDVSQWDLVIDADGNLAVAAEPYSLAQDAASAIRTFLGECFWDTTVGVPWLQQILAMQPSLPLLKAQLVAAAMTVPDVASAVVFLSSFNGRLVTGQVQVTATKTQTTSVATFIVNNPQGP